jgi:hypothetical protein
MPGLTAGARRGTLPRRMHPFAALAGFSLVRPEGSHWAWGAAAWFVVVLPLCLGGMGLVARRIPAIGPLGTALLPAVGLALFIFAGGLLNLAGLAGPLEIWILLAIGMFASLRALASWAGARKRWSATGGTAAVVAVAAALLAVTLASQLAPRAYNWQDDLQKYFAHPVRMLETGTVYGSPLSAIGAENLGGLAFVQGSALVCLPLAGINGVDAVLGLLLCLIPVVALGISRPGLGAVGVLAVASTAIIDPYYVNVSALFLGSALVMASILASGTAQPGEPFGGGSPALAGLIYAALAALKPTLLLFVAPHLAGVAIAASVAQGSLRAGVRWAVAASACTACFMAPWVLVHLPHYLAPGIPEGADHAALEHHALNLLSAEPFETGITGMRAFTLLAAGLVVLAAVGLGVSRKTPSRPASGVAAGIGGVVAAAAYPLMIFVFPRVVGYADADPIAVRYFIPLAIGAFPIALFAAEQSIEESAHPPSRASRVGICLLLGLASLAGFGGTAAGRYADALRYRTFLPYPGARDPALAQAMAAALGSAKQGEVRGLQAMIPPGASLVAWIYSPYFLDFSRNPIFDAEIAGISNRWAVLPKADYIMWEYRGSPDLASRVRRLAATFPPVNRGRIAPMLEFERALTDNLRTGTVIFHNEEYVLLRTAR